MSMDDLIDKLLESLWLQDRLSYNTLQSYRRDLVKVAARLTEGGQDWLSADEFALSDAVYAEGEKNTSQARALSACKRMYGWLEETGQRADNPTRFLKAPKSERKLPTLITEAQIDALLAEPDVETLHGLRDKALLEVMYATGLRVTEAVKLTLSDIDLHRGSIRTIGKGDKLRLVPLGQEAAY
ncbi:MAG: tyrosine-type recombinase/integrase, partial [Neisseria sp.]|nr:tyrosine-type recombinase/integrase [Neisseria sp.]